MVVLMMRTQTWGWVIAGTIAFIALFVGFLALTKPPKTYFPPGGIATSASSSSGSNSTSSAPETIDGKVTLNSPSRNAEVGHSFSVIGQAPGPWFFEAQFPLMVKDRQGNAVGHATAQAQGDWQTEDMVDFSTTMQIDAIFHGPATLVLMKDNPSGLPEHDDAVEVPIIVD